MSPKSELSEPSLDVLYRRAKEAGTNLFGKRLYFTEDPTKWTVGRTTLSHLLSLDQDENYIDEHEFVFFPLRGGGLDVSSEDWHSATRDWVDDDGRIYTALDGVFTVVEVDVEPPGMPSWLSLHEWT